MNRHSKERQSPINTTRTRNYHGIQTRIVSRVLLRVRHILEVRVKNIAGVRKVPKFSVNVNHWQVFSGQADHCSIWQQNINGR